MNKPIPQDFSTGDLVSEQNGFRWIFLAILISLVIGFLFRGAYSSERLTHLIRMSLTQLPRDISLDFDRARINLSDGILPDLSVVVEGVKASSSNECWGHPLLEVNELRLPVSLRDLVKGKLFFRDAVMDQVQLSFLSAPKKCESSPNVPSGYSAAPAAPPASPETQITSDQRPPETSDSAEQKSESKFGRNISIGGSELSVYVRTFVLKVPDQYQTTLVFDRASLIPEGNGNSQFEGTLKLSGESFMTEASSKALVTAKYYSGPMRLDYEINGNWREGHYEAKGNYSPLDQTWEIDGHLKNLPVATIIPVLRKYKFIDKNFGSEQMWLSAEFRTPNAAMKKQGVQFELSNLILDGDLGEVSAPHARVTSWFPMKMEPIDLSLRGLKFDKLMDFLQVDAPSPFIANRGIFNGKIHWVSENELHVEGEHSGLEFVFSNRGVRKNQVISLMTGKADLMKGRWLVRIESIRPLDGIFLGQIALTYDSSSQVLKGELQIDEMSLSPEVQKLMTSGGGLGRWAGVFNFELKDQKVIAMTGEIDANDLIVEGLTVAKTRMNFRTRGGVLLIDAKSRDLTLAEGALATWIQQIHPLKIPQETNSLNVHFETSVLKDMKWRLSPVQMDGITLSADAGWKENEDLYGEMYLKDRTGEKPQDLVWKLSGTRANPVIEKISDRKN